MSREHPPAPPAPQRRFIAIPFSSGCRSHSSVDVLDTARHTGNGKKPHQQGAETGAVPGGASARPPAPAAAGSKGESLVARLLRGFKNLSQIFAVYDEEEEEEEEEEREMVIGLPTDVKHVAHIGWDGSTSTTSSLRSWNRAAPPPPATSSSSSSSAPAAAAPQQQQEQYPLPLPTLSMRQFELAMAAQAAGGATTASGGGGGAGHRRHS